MLVCLCGGLLLNSPVCCGSGLVCSGFHLLQGSVELERAEQGL
jgi:hypothetical protein